MSTSLSGKYAKPCLSLHTRGHGAQETCDMLELFERRVLARDVLLAKDRGKETCDTFRPEQLSTQQKAARLAHVREDDGLVGHDAT